MDCIFIFVCDSMRAFSLTILPKVFAIAGTRSGVEIKLEVLLVSFHSTYLKKNIKICSYFSHISAERMVVLL